MGPRYTTLDPSTNERERRLAIFHIIRDNSATATAGVMNSSPGGTFYEMNSMPTTTGDNKKDHVAWVVVG